MIIKKFPSVASARMSIPFSLATALSSGDAGVNSLLKKAVDDFDNKLLAKKVFLHEDKKVYRSCP